MGKLDGEIAFVTGGEAGIGRAIALAFAREGASVFILYHRAEDAAAKAKQDIEAYGARAAVAKADVGVEAEVVSSFFACVERLGRPTILVNNAGINAAGIKLVDLSLERWELALRTDLTGPFLCCREFLRRRDPTARGGKIINITSVHQDIPRRGGAEYDAAKGGLRNLTTTLALELAEMKINVNNIAPGMVLTAMNQEAIDDPGTMKEQVANIPWRRAGEPEDVAKLAVYLASRDSDYVTGATFVIDGGLMLNMGQGA
jgi:glucose 1-dehydrogenase